MTWTDIATGGWVSAMPARWRPYLLLARLDRPVGIWLLFLPGAWGILLARADWRETARLLLLFAVGAAAMRGAGCVVNDLWDRDIDRLVARTAGRPLASGAVSVRGAIAFGTALLFVAFLVFLQLPALCQVLCAASLVLVALYPAAKRVTWWPQLVMGFTFGFGAPAGYAAAARQIDWAWAAIYAAAIAWDLGFDTIYGFQDMEDDALIGVRSTSRRWAHAPKRFLAACYTAMMALLVAAMLLAHFPPAALILLSIPAALLWWQVRALDIRDPARCLALFKLNREVGLFVALAFAAGRW